MPLVDRKYTKVKRHEAIDFSCQLSRWTHPRLEQLGFRPDQQQAYQDAKAG